MVSNDLIREKSDSERSIGLYDENIDEFEDNSFRITLKECQLLDPSPKLPSEVQESLNESRLASK